MSSGIHPRNPAASRSLSQTESLVCQHSPAGHGAARVTFLPKTSSYRNAVFLQEHDRTAVSTQSSLPRYTGRLFIATSNLEVAFCFHFWFALLVFFGGQLFISVAFKIRVPPKPVCSCPHSTQGCDSSCSNNTSSTDATEFQQSMKRKQNLAVAAARAKSSCSVALIDPSERRKGERNTSLPGQSVQATS